MQEKNTPSAPPIASPHGAGEAPHQSPEPQTEISPLLPIHLSFESALRSSSIAFFYPINFFAVLVIAGILDAILYPAFISRPGNPLSIFSPGELWIPCCVAFVFLMASLITFWNLIFSRSFEVEVQQTGLHIHYPRRTVVVPWSKFLWIHTFDGNICIATFTDGVLIPREAFASRPQSQKFAASLRLLRHTNGTTWETTFGRVDSVQG